jgi:GET complex subunit GET2
VRPPMIVQMALPSLPPPFPNLILNGFKYYQILGTLLDDVAGVIVGLGIFVWLMGLVSP